MVKNNFLKEIYREIKDEPCSINYLASVTFLSKNHIWNTLRLLKVMKLVEETINPEKANSKVYKLKKDYPDFYAFLEDFEARL